MDKFSWIAFAVAFCVVASLLLSIFHQLIQIGEELKELRKEFGERLAPRDTFHTEYQNSNIHAMLADIHRALKVLTK